MGRTKRTRHRKQQRTAELKSALDVYFVDLTRWMRKEGWLPVCRLHPVEFPDTGRGMLTKNNISGGAELVRIPLHLLMTTDTVGKSGIACLFHHDTKVAFYAQQVLATFLLWEKHLGPLSQWGDYIRSLPSEFTTPLFCSPEELSVLPTFLYDVVFARREKISSTFQVITHLLKELKYCYVCSKNCAVTFSDFVIEFKDYVWAWSVVNTRSVFLNSSDAFDSTIKILDKNCLALAPYLDMFNHSNEACVDAGLSADQKSYCVWTSVPFKKYSQVFFNYGPHSNAHLFLEYGFIIPNSKHDYVSFTVDEIVHSARVTYPNYEFSKWKFDFITSRKLNEGLFCTSDGLSFNTKAVIYVLILPDSAKQNIHKILYSDEFDEGRSDAILRIGASLVDRKRSELIAVLNQLSEIVHGECTTAAEVAKDFIAELIAVLFKGSESLSNSV